MKAVIPERTITLIIFSTIIVLFSCIGIIGANFAFMVTDKIYQGVFIGTLSVGGLSIEETKQKVTALYQETYTGKPALTIKYEDAVWTLTAEEIDLILDPEATALRAYHIGRSGVLPDRLSERYNAINSGITVPFSVTYNQEKLTARLTEIAQSISHPPQDATIAFDGSVIQLIPETTGRQIDLARLIFECEHKVHNEISPTVQVTAENKVPRISAQQLAHINGVIATFTTTFDPGYTNRAQNIRLAVKSLNKLIIMPNEIISFNQIVGPRIEEHGFKEAPVFIDGKIVPDWGGGVCQVSSTLYNAILLADLEIRERTPHFRPPAYVAVGRDATVADNLLDFRFKNTFSEAVFIAADIKDTELTISILGRLNPDAPQIEIINTDTAILEPETIIKQDPTLEFGRQITDAAGEKGIKTNTYRLKMKDGTEISRELLASDEFKAEDRVIRVGTRVRPNGK